MVAEGIDGGASDGKIIIFAIWSKTFKLDDLAIALYLVKVDQMVVKGVRTMYHVSCFNQVKLRY